MLFSVLVISALASSRPQGLVLSQGATSEAQLIKAGAKAPAFDKILTMLQNLVAQIESEEQADNADYTSYMSWFERQHTTTSSAVTALTTKIQTIIATLGELGSQQQGLTTQVQQQTAELDQEQGQLDDAKDKRSSEHDGFVKEQLEFDNAIAGCNKAVEILIVHYGDGSPKESTKPAWMSLLTAVRAIHRSAVLTGRKMPKSILNFAQQTQTPGMTGAGMFNAYDSGTNSGEAMNIVDQVKLLSQTFQEDKDSSIEQETQLQGAFETLMGQKSALISTLTKERDAQQSVLNGLNQQVSEQENARATSQSTMQSEQAYLTQTETQQRDTAATYEGRKADQAAEKKAVSEAIGVIQSAAPALMQMHKSFQRRLTLLQVAGPDPRLRKAELLLKAKATKLHSQLLATAAASTGTGDVLVQVVDELHGLVTRLDQEQASEASHKEWCEKELSDTAAKKSRHEALVLELQKQITEVEGTISDKQDSAEANADSIDEADRKFNDLKAIRDKAAADYEAELEDYNDAIDALNQATDMLADFYREGSFVQAKALRLKQAPTATDAPSVAGGARDSAGGMNVVVTLKQTRQEFDAGKSALSASESKAVSDFQNAKSAHDAARQALVEAGNRLTVELQTAQNEMVMAKESLESNEKEVSSSQDYLTNVGKSCQSLLEHFTDRSELRSQEKLAIQDAVTVLSAQ